MEKLLKDLQVVIDHLKNLGPLLPETASLAARQLERVKNSLAARVQPTRLVVALNDPVSGMDHKPVTVVGSTAPVTMFVVDHRNSFQERLSVVSGPVLAIPSEMIEVVSDEAAVYLQQDAQLLKHITNNC